MVVLLLVPEIVLLIDSVRDQTDSERLPSIVRGERVLRAVAVRVGRGAEEEEPVELED